MLQSFIQRNAQGNAIPKSNRLHQWLNQELLHGYVGRLEDPVEDVFISNVITHCGNNRIFEGVWEANDFWAQEAVDALKRISHSEWQEGVMENCCALLQLSEALAGRCGLQRFEIGAGEVRADLVLPPHQEVLNRSKLVCFTQAELLALGISSSALEPFIHPMTPAIGSIGKSSLDRRPLVREAGIIVVTVPAAISVALRLYIAEEVIAKGVVGEFEKALSSQQAAKTFVEGRIGLRGTIVDSPKLPPIPEGMQIAAQEIVKFDEGKYAHLLFIPDSVTAFHKTQITGMLDLLLDDRELIKYCQACAFQVAGEPNFTGGMTIAVVGGLGRAFTFGQTPPPKWHALALRLPDFLALGRIVDTDFLLIWSLHEQKAALGEHQIHLANLNGELNLLGFWKKENERLVPQGAGPGTTLYVATDFLTDLRNTSRMNYDFHAILRRNPEAWVPVRRLTADAFFKDATHDPIFVHEHDVFHGRLRGVAETVTRGWWVSAKRHETNEDYNDILYRIWDCVLQWMPKISRITEKALAPLVEGPIEFFVDCSALEIWKSQNLNDLPPEEELEIGINQSASAIRLQMPLGFVRYFSQAKNVAERKLIFGCLFGVCRLSGISFTKERLDKLVDEIVVNDEARFFHVAHARTFRQYQGADHAKRVVFVRDAQTNFASLGLAQRILSNSRTVINGLRESNTFLHAAVDDCWNRTRNLLLTLDRASVIEIALQNVEAIENDKEHWRLTASALLAIHPDTEDVFRAARERDHQRSLAELTSRVLAEMAICTSPLEGGRQAGKFELGQLLSLLSLLLFAAKCSDAIQFEFVESKVDIHPNGEFSIDESYMDEIVYPYIKEHFSEQFTEAARSYVDYFRERSSPSEQNTETASKFDPEMERAFVDEYGLTLEDVIAAEIALGRNAMTDRSMVVHRSNSQIRQILVEAGLSVESAKSFLLEFSLWPRGEWDKTPNGYTNKDWYPWRFRRRLSLVARPLVQFGLDDDADVYFAPGQVEASVRLLVTRLIRGDLPPEDFHSSRMRSWVGEATRRRGDAFEQEVADDLGKIDLFTLVARPMTEFGADESYGDLDVAAWTLDEERLYLIECKCLRFARTIAEIGEQLREFRGIEKDRLARHIRRCDWVSKNIETFRKVAKMNGAPKNIIPVLVTNTLVPMQFVNDLPLPSKSVVSLKNLRKWVIDVQSST